MKKAQLFGVIWLSVGLFGLSCRRPIIRQISTTTQAKDSVLVQEKLRPIHTVLPGQRISFGTQLPIVLAQPFEFFSKSERGGATITISKEGRLTGKCELDSLMHIIYALDRDIKQISRRSSGQTQTLVQTVKKSYWYDIAARWLLALIILLLLFIILFKKK